MTDIPEWLVNQPYFRANKEGVKPTEEQIIANLTNASKLQGDLSSSHIRIPDANDSDSLTTAKHKAMQHIPGLTVIPTGDDAEAQEAFFQSIGRPETADKYVVPEGIENNTGLDAVREAALADGWTQSQFANYVTREAQSRTSDQEAGQTAIDENMAKLKTEWGQAYADRLSTVKDFVSVDGVPADIRNAVEAGTLTSESMQWIHSIANAVASEDVQLSGQTSASDTLTPGEAAEGLQQIESVLYKMKNTDPNYPAQIAKQERYLRAMRGERVSARG
jgi:hypothetical protein